MTRNFSPIDMPPGVVEKPTKAKDSANWRSANMVRWSNGVMAPFGGIEKIAYTPPATNFRDVHTWTDLSGLEWTAYLTEDNVYVEYNGDLVSINPTPALVSLASVSVAGGYGRYLYGFSTYGDARPVDPALATFGPIFTLDNWGQNLIAMTSIDGRLLQWVPSLPPTPMTVVANAPQGRTFVVHPEGYVMIFEDGGIQNSLAWCDKRDITDWNFADVNSQAGEEDIQPFAPMISAIHTGDLALFFTTKKAYTADYIGLPYIFRVKEIGDSSVPISGKSVARTTIGAVWFSQSGVWVYNGSTIVGIVCDIWDWINDNIDWDQARQVAIATSIIDKSEVWFSFPSTGSLVNNMTAVFNFRESWWSQALFGRSAGQSSDYAHKQRMTDRLSAYLHESGNSYTDVAVRPYAESFTIYVSGGSQMATLRQIEPEIEGNYTDLRFSVAAKTNRNDGQVETYTPQRSILSNGLVDIMTTGKDFRIKVEDVGANVNNWTVGVIGVDIVGRGRKK